MIRPPLAAVVMACGCAAAPLAAETAPSPGEAREAARPASLLARARAAGGSLNSGGDGAASTQPGAIQRTRGGPVFTPGGVWARVELGAQIGGQRVNQDLGFSRNIFQTVSAQAEDVGFGEHYGARGSVFVNRHFGVEAGYTRTRSVFEISVEDEEAGLTVFEDGIRQESQEFSASAVAQIPLAAMTPYATVGYGWRESDIGEDAPFRAGTIVVGAGMKVVFPLFPVALSFDYRFMRYPAAEPLVFSEGGTDVASVSALTLGILIRLGERD